MRTHGIMVAVALLLFGAGLLCGWGICRMQAEPSEGNASSEGEEMSSAHAKLTRSLRHPGAQSFPELFGRLEPLPENSRRLGVRLLLDAWVAEDHEAARAFLEDPEYVFSDWPQIMDSWYSYHRAHGKHRGEAALEGMESSFAASVIHGIAERDAPLAARLALSRIEKPDGFEAAAEAIVACWPSGDKDALIAFLESPVIDEEARLRLLGRIASRDPERICALAREAAMAADEDTGGFYRAWLAADPARAVGYLVEHSDDDPKMASALVTASAYLSDAELIRQLEMSSQDESHSQASLLDTVPVDRLLNLSAGYPAVSSYDRIDTMIYGIARQIVDKAPERALAWYGGLTGEGHRESAAWVLVHDLEPAPVVVDFLERLAPDVAHFVALQHAYDRNFDDQLPLEEPERTVKKAEAWLAGLSPLERDMVIHQYTHTAATYFPERVVEWASRHTDPINAAIVVATWGRVDRHAAVAWFAALPEDRQLASLLKASPHEATGPSETHMDWELMAELAVGMESAGTRREALVHLIRETRSQWRDETEAHQSVVDGLPDGLRAEMQEFLDGAPLPRLP